jgi:hypothetical protein
MFKARYERDAAGREALVLQSHPNAWDDTRWAGFVEIVNFLRGRGCVFMTPSEYLRGVEGERAESGAAGASKPEGVPEGATERRRLREPG